MALRVEFIIDWRRTTAFQESRFPRESCRVLTLSFWGVVIRPIGLPSEPARWTFSGWDDKVDDMLFAQESSVSGQFAQQWKLRMMAQGAALKEVAGSRLRRLWESNKSAKSTDIKMGE